MTLTGLLTNKVVVAVFAFLVSFGVAAGASAVMFKSDAKATLPETTESIPILAPVETGPIPTADDPSVPDGSGGGGSGGGGSGGGGSGGGGGEAGLSPVVGESADFIGDVREVGVPAGGADEDLSLITDATRFVDLCAGAAPGSDLPAGCPSPSTGGTILPLSGDDPLPQTVRFLRVPTPGGSTNRCSVRTSGDDQEPWAVVTRNPGTTELEYWPLPEGALASTPPDPDTVVTIDASTDDESNPEHSLWRGWFEDGTVGTHSTRSVQACQVLHDLRPGQRYVYRVTSTDIFGSSASEENQFIHADGRDRPPVSISALSDTRYTVRVPIRTSEREHAFAIAVPRSGSSSGTCADLEAAGIDRGIYDVGTIAEIPASEREADGYPWDPDYDQARTFDLRDLSEGRAHSVCIWWYSGPARSFDVERITDRAVHPLTTPNRFRFQVTMENLQFFRSVGEREVEITVSSAGSQLCRAQYPLDDRGASAYGYDDLFCDLTSDDGSRSVGDALDVKITGPFGQSLTSRVDVSARPGADHSEYYSLNIPAERAVRRLCGTFLDTGGCADRPPRDESVGTADLRVDFVDGPHEGGDTLILGPDGSFPGADEPETEPPSYAQIDAFTSSLQTIVRRSDALRIVANLDRPATIRAYLDPPSGVSSCLLPGASGSASSGLAASHNFVLDGLCADSHYFVSLEITDAEGDVSYAIGHTLVEAEMYWNGRAGTPPIEATISARLTVLETPDPSHLNYVAGTGRIDLYNLFFPGSVGRCVSSLGEELAVGSPFGGFTNEVVITIELSSSVDPTPELGFCSGESFRATTSIRAVIPIERLLRETVTLTSPEEDTLRVQLDVSASPRL